MAAPVIEIEMQDVVPPDPGIAQSAAPSAHLPPSHPHHRLFDRIIEHNLKYLKIVCRLGILPFDVDVENRHISPATSTIRWCWFYCISFTCLVKVSYVLITLAASVVNPDWLQVLHLPIHLGIAIAASAILDYLFLRPKDLRLVAMLLNAVLANCDRVKSCSVQQLLLAAMPIGLTTLIVPITLVFPFLTTIVYQFGTLLRVAMTEWNLDSTIDDSPAPYWTLRFAAYSLDAFPTLWLAIGAIFMVISHVIILEVLHAWCDDLSSKTNRFNLAECYGELVDIQIIVGFFNMIYRQVIFMEKSTCFMTGISAFVLVFLYGFNDNVIMGVVNLYAGITCLMMYPLIYEKAALISGGMEMAKRSLLLASVMVEDEKERAFWQQRVRGIRVLPILCGSRAIERESLPIFYDFFFSNFISVLLSM